MKTDGVKKILVTGASGLLGCNIVKRAKRHFRTYEIIPTHRTKPLFSGSVKMNIANENDVLQVFTKFSPDAVVHTAAETMCEVSSFWNEIKHGYKYFEIVNDWNQKWAGLGVLYV